MSQVEIEILVEPITEIEVVVSEGSVAVPATRWIWSSTDQCEILKQGSNVAGVIEDGDWVRYKALGNAGDPVFIIIGVFNAATAGGDKDLEASYDNPWSIII